MTTDVERGVAASTVLAPWFEGQAAANVLWVAFSGGVDSTVLLHLLRGLAGVAAIHVDHGLNRDAGRWTRHCAEVAATFGVPFHSQAVRVAPGGNVEAAARRLRYEAWQRRLGHGDVLALAHHADDQAETRLWQLLTGRHPGGMPAQRPLGAGRLVRPLLGVRRRDIARYAERFGLRWIEDPANADESYDRNYIRHRLMPLVEQRFPSAIERLSAPRRERATTLTPLSMVAADEPAEVEDWLLGAGLPLAKRTVAEIHRQNNAARDRNPRVAVTPGVCAWRFAGAWHLVRRHASDCDQRLAKTGDDVALTGGILTWRWGVPGLPSDRRLDVRWRRGGERIRPVGRQRTKTLKALLQEGRVPPWRRDRWPLLYQAESLAAVPGLAIAAHAVVAEGWQPSWTPRDDTLTTFDDTFGTTAEPDLRGSSTSDLG